MLLQPHLEHIIARIKKVLEKKSISKKYLAQQKCKREKQKKWEYHLKGKADFCRTGFSSLSEETRFMYGSMGNPVFLHNHNLMGVVSFLWMLHDIKRQHILFLMVLT